MDRDQHNRAPDHPDYGDPRVPRYAVDERRPPQTFVGALTGRLASTLGMSYAEVSKEFQAVEFSFVRQQYRELYPHIANLWSGERYRK